MRRRDIRNVAGNLGYRFWPESWIINWEPGVNYGQNYDFDGILQDENLSARLGFSFVGNMHLFTNMSWDMERFGGPFPLPPRPLCGGACGRAPRRRGGLRAPGPGRTEDPADGSRWSAGDVSSGP